MMIDRDNKKAFNSMLVPMVTKVIQSEAGWLEADGPAGDDAEFDAPENVDSDLVSQL